MGAVSRQPFFAQSGKLDVTELEGAAEVDQREFFEGNSVLRGQTPVGQAARKPAE